MAQNYGLFWNSVNSDRIYNADSLSDWLKKFFTTGVFTDELQITATSGMVVKSATGYANINGKVMFFEAENQFTLSPANSTYPRIDTIVVERNDTNREISIHAVTGLYSGSTPSATAPVRVNNVYQIVLAQIYVGAGVTEVTQANITDTRTDTSICGYITGTVYNMDFSQFAAQFAAYYDEFKVGNEADFNTWFNSMKGQLSTDAAGHLQTEIDATNALVATKAAQTDVTDLQNDGLYKSLTIAADTWSAATTTIDGIAYYTNTINLTAVYDEHPIISCGVSGTLPTEAESTAYDLVKQALADASTKVLTLYAEEKPASAFVILVKGVA